MRAYLWVADLQVSRKVGQKLAQLHDLDWRDVRDAVVCVAGLRASEDFDAGDEDHPGRGWRWIVRTRIDGRPVKVVLYEAEEAGEDVYRLGSAYHTD